jgi:Flp pilus assembly protein CpaB
MNRSTQFLIGLLAIILALAAGLYGRNAYLKEVSTYQIPVPVQDIAPYTVLDASQFQMREMPRAMETLPYFQSIQDLNGKIAMSKLPAGLPVARVSAVVPTQFRLADSAFEVVSIPVEPVSAVGGQIRIGQRVNLYQMEKSAEANATQSNPQNTQEEPIEVTQIASSVLVVDVRTAQGASAGPNSTEAKEGGSVSSGSQQVDQVQILTLALAPDQVQVVLDAVAASKKQGGLLWTTLALP